MDEYEQELSGIEQFATDEVFDEMCGLAQTFAERLEDGTCDLIEAQDTVEKLNEMLIENGFSETWASVTGDIFIGNSQNYFDETGNARPDKSQLTPVVGNPLCVFGFELKTWMDIDNSNELAAKSELVLNGQVLFDFEPEDEDGIDEFENDGQGEYMFCVVPIRPETYLMNQEITPRTAERWLAVCYPEIYGEIVAAMVQTDDEAGALMALKDMTIEVGELSEESRSELAANLESYTNSALSLDMYVPYLVELTGKVERFYGKILTTKTINVENTGKTLMTIARTSYLENENGELELWLHGQLIDVKPGSADEVRMPLETVDSIIAGRQFYPDK